MTAPRPRLLIELLLVALIFLASNLNSALRQKQNTLNGGTAWETPYYTMAEKIVAHEPLADRGPYVFRIATPWLAAKISPTDLFRGFRIVNITGSALACCLMAWWLRGYIGDVRIRLLLVTLFVIQWDAPPRLVYHSPVHVDAWIFVFLFAGLLVIQRYLVKPTHGQIVLLSVLAVVGAYFREATLLVPVTLLAVHGPLKLREGRWVLKLPPLPACIPFICGFISFLSTRLVAHQTDDYSFIQTIYRFLYEKPVLTYLHAWLLAFGPVLFILVFDWKNTRRWLEREPWLVLFLLTGAWLGFFGGTDTERLQYWSMPGVYLLLGRSIVAQRQVLSSWPLIAFFAVGQILSTRILWTTPDTPTDYSHTFPVLQQFGSHVQLLDLFSFHGYRPKETLSLVEFLIYGAIVLWWMSQRSRRLQPEWAYEI